MQDFGTKADNSPPPGGQLSAAEFNNLATENENAVLRGGLSLSGASDTQLAQSVFLHSVKATSFQDSGAANAYVATPISGASGVLLPASYAAMSGAVVSFKAANSSTAASTLNIGQTTGTLIGSKAIRTQSDVAIPAGAIQAGQTVQLIYNPAFDSGNGAWELLPWANSQISQISQPAGTLNTRIIIAAAAATATVTADAVLFNTTFGGRPYLVGSFNKSINLATTGAGGMDTGTAPVNGYVSLYAIYNPTSGASAVLACAQATSSGWLYTGPNMPVGYTASVLISSNATNASSQFKISTTLGRIVYIPQASVYTSSGGTIPSPISIPLSAVVPSNAKAFGGNFNAASTVATAIGITLAADANNSGYQNVNSAQSVQITSPFRCPITTPQTAYITATAGGGTPTYNINVSSYEF